MHVVQSPSSTFSRHTLYPPPPPSDLGMYKGKNIIHQSKEYFIVFKLLKKQYKLRETIQFSNMSCFSPTIRFAGENVHKRMLLKRIKVQYKRQVNNKIQTWNDNNSDTFILEAKKQGFYLKTCLQRDTRSWRLFKIHAQLVGAWLGAYYRWMKRQRIADAVNNMASRSSQITSTQPRLHGACILPGHILVNERFHGSEIVKALQGLCCIYDD